MKVILLVVLAFTISGCATYCSLPGSEGALVCTSHLKKKADKRRQKYVADNPDLAPGVKEGILAGKINIGMMPEQTMASWGEPQNINRTMNALGVTEQWVYGLGQYVYFRDGKLSSIQQSHSK